MGLESVVHGRAVCDRPVLLGRHLVLDPGAPRMTSPRNKVSAAAPFAYDGLDRLIHEKARLGILASLASHADGLSFLDLKQLCALTDGNLNRHLQVLQDGGLVEVRKESRGSRT